MHSLIVYDDVAFPSDSQNRASAGVERDANGNIFVSGVNASTFLQSLGSLFVGGAVYTTSSTLDNKETFALANAAGGAITLTLPPVATNKNQMYLILKTDSTANLVTVKGNAAEVLQPINANTYTALTAQGMALLVWNDGTQWYYLVLVGGSHLLSTQATAPTAAAGANAGTSPPAPVGNAACDDRKGSLTFGTGTGPAAGAQAVVTFNQAYAAAPFVVLEPINSATAALLPYVTATAGGFTVNFQTAPAASQANTVYGVNYHVLG